MSTGFGDCRNDTSIGASGGRFGQARPRFRHRVRGLKKRLTSIKAGENHRPPEGSLLSPEQPRKSTHSWVYRRGRVKCLRRA